MGFNEKCKLCNREFTNQDEYNEHLYLHPFTKQCVKCNATMNQKHDTYRGSSYVCSKCGYTELYANWDNI